MKSSIRVQLCFEGHTDHKWVRYTVSLLHTNFQFPLLNLRQAASATQPQMLLCSQSNVFTSRQSLCFIKRLGARVLVSVHSPTLPASPSRCPGRENSQTAPWESIWVTPESALQSFQFVWLNRWRLSVQLCERKADTTASERAASLRSAWHQRRCRPLTAEQKHMVPHLASS